MSYPDIVPIAPYADLADLGPGRRQARILSYPRYYRAGERWGVTVEGFTRADAPWVARATEGVHTLAVRRDGLCLCTHRGHELALRLRGIVALADVAQPPAAVPAQRGAAEPHELLAIDLSSAAWRLDTARLDLGVVAWEHDSGARYEVRYVADGVHDRLVLTDDLRRLIRARLPAGAARFGLAFDCTMPAALRRLVDGREETDHDTESPIEMLGDVVGGASAPRVRQRLSPFFLPDPRAASDAEGAGWRERWRFRNGILVQTVPVDALDAAAELRTSITYQEGVDGYSGCTDANLYYGSWATYNAGATAEVTLGQGTSGDMRHFLIRFDIGLTGVAAVNSATLSLYASTTANLPADFGFARVLRSWGEGVHDCVPATSGECSWNCYAYPSTWTTAGCESVGNDRVALSSGISVSSGAGWKDLAVASAVTDWLVNGYANYGIVIRLVTEGSNHTFKVCTRNYASDTSLRPKLTIDYTPSGTVLDGAGLARGLSRALPRMMS